MKLDIYFKFYLKGANIVQEFDNFSEILKNPQMLNMLSKFMQSQNNTSKNQPENNNLKSYLSNNNSCNFGNFDINNMQMIANLLPILSNLNNNNNFASMLGMLSSNNSQANNMQSIVMLMNLISQMQKNNQDKNNNKNIKEIKQNNS